jgi:hypothetical protein
MHDEPANLLRMRRRALRADCAEVGSGPAETSGSMNSHRCRDLFTVARPEAALHAYLSRYFAGRPDVDVVSDRRYGERRRWSEPTATERRRAKRRRYSIAAHLAALGFAIVTVLR